LETLPTYHFSRKERLARKQDFQSILKSSNKITYKYLLVLYRSNQCCFARLGMILPKRIVQKAVDRNMIKRVMRESFRHHKQVLQNLDIMIVLRSKLHVTYQKTLRQDLENIWEKLGSVCN